MIQGIGREMWRGAVAMGALLIVAGILVGAGCNSGCRYVLRHVNVEWSR